jgi:uncharacterized membrane protein
MEVQLVAAGKGWQWIVDGFSLFRRSPAMWLALTLLLGVIWLASMIVPLLGPLLFNLFSPALFVGLMLGCRALERGEELQVGHLFAGFRDRLAPLVTVGGVYLVGTILVVGVVLVAAGGTMLPAVLSKSGTDVETLRAALRSMALALAIGAAVYLPLIMLIWFAPLLVVFEGMAPLAAMKLSFAACLKNTLPFTVYGLAILGLWFVLSLPAVMGPAGAVIVVALLVASIPVLVCSIYASYKDVFVARGAPAAGGNPFLR